MKQLEDEESLSRRGFLVGTAGAAAAVGASGTALAQEDEDGGGNESDGGGGDGGGNESDDGGGGGGGETVEVTVGPGGDPSFDPDSLEIPPGTTVHWVWDSDNHNVVPTEQPGDAEWDGHPDIINEGEEYEHTFEVEGDYHYICEPHVGQGMEGDITIDPDATVGGGGASGPLEVIPEAAWTLIIATTAGMLSVLSLAYAFMRYGGPTGE